MMGINERLVLGAAETSMHTGHLLQERLEYDSMIQEMRENEYPMLKDATYLDHAGTTLYAKSLLETFSADMLTSLHGNPHSFSPSSQAASQRVDNVRLKVLRLFNADPAHFDCIFVANATAGIKLVMEGFSCVGDFWYGYHRDAHTSLVGVRELAKSSRCFASDEEVEDWFEGCERVESQGCGPGLFAYPAQSNMNGRRLPLDWCSRLRQSGKNNTFSLLDAAALVSTCPLDLGYAASAPDFTVLSFYKMYGFPDLGALIVRKEAGHVLKRRRYFGGGTVEAVACLKGDEWCFRKEGELHESLEDGTLPIHSILALDVAITVHERLYGGFGRISAHTRFLVNLLYQKLKEARHANGRPVCEIYDEGLLSSGREWTNGPVLALNFRDHRGQWVSNHEVQKLAGVKNIHLRTGNVCNPGGISHVLGIMPHALRDNYAAGLRCGNEKDVIGGQPTGIIRVSFGAMSTLADVEELLHFVGEFFINRSSIELTTSFRNPTLSRFYIESLIVYPIKSCGGWYVPQGMHWPVRPEGLAFDREWCLIHQGTYAALSQKRYPKMALFKPSFDFDQSHLRIRWTGLSSWNVPDEIPVPLFSELDDDQYVLASVPCATDVCGDKIQSHVYESQSITDFFSKHLGVPVYLARVPSKTTTRDGPISARRAKPESSLLFQSAFASNADDMQVDAVQRHKAFNHMPGTFPTPPPSPPRSSATNSSSNPADRPVLLVNESPLLIINLSSVATLNAMIRAGGGTPITSDVFRANIVLGERLKSALPEVKESPPPQTPAGSGDAVSANYTLPPLCFAEDDFTTLQITSSPSSTLPATSPSSIQSKPLASSPTFSPATTSREVTLTILGPCRRCQMVTIDQATGERGQEPFVTLAKTRRWQGGVWFGVHAGLAVSGPGAEADGYKLGKKDATGQMDNGGESSKGAEGKGASHDEIGNEGAQRGVPRAKMEAGTAEEKDVFFLRIGDVVEACARSESSAPQATERLRRLQNVHDDLRLFSGQPASQIVTPRVYRPTQH